jgi:pSer/pThr/pTyr-binding forkhead associated (FHA) protein
MRDGATRKMTESDSPTGSFLTRCRASVVFVSGPAKGQEISLAQPVQTLGRGPGVDFAIGDEHMSRQHLAFDLTAEGFRVRDLGSTNGIVVNGEKTDSAELEHGDRIQVGSSELQYLVEERADAGPTYVLS